MTLTLVAPLNDNDVADDDVERIDTHYGVAAATQMLRAKEVTLLEFLALCEEAAQLADADAEAELVAGRYS